ncbi:hypothetical protein OKW21_003000 [Catalinimonas alkaloidigena]|uniref:potassium channel family protein n=1 Tax=Catalinimonas alkaloidigena TaxID=1075417 RepID=UPI002404C011|nr:potassium channel family protein [Catalinimonas alkaloidigena]MDF9797737.1 hypothetical protein [Catalinimonas alkaloidigena]
MSEALCQWLGIVLLIGVILDIIITTLSPQGAGFFSKFIISGVWKIFLRACGKKGDQPILDYYPTIVSVIMLTFWIALLWFSNALILISDQNSVLTTNRIPTSYIEKIYYTGYTISTLGNGEFIPGSNFWMIYTNFLAFTGLLMITIGITYLVPLLQGEIQRRTLCLHIASFGDSVERILIQNWNGRDFSNLTDHFDDLRQEIFYLGQNHKAYPILHHSHSHIKHRSTSITISMLDEALTIMMHCIPQNHWPNKTSIRSLRFAITSYLSTLNSAFITPAKETPPSPDFEKLKHAGIPVTSDENSLRDCYEDFTDRRKLLLGLLHTDGWQWKDLNFNTLSIDE